MTDDNLLPFAFPVIQRKKITAAFDGGRISSDGGVMLLAQADRRLGLADLGGLALRFGRRTEQGKTNLYRIKRVLP